eukprot:11998244-Ditylum_brightwellii.AAC.1
MRAKLKSTNEYEVAAEASDVIQLLRLIKKIAYQYESQRYPHRAVHAAMHAFHLTSQKEGTTLEGCGRAVWRRYQHARRADQERTQGDEH